MKIKKETIKSNKRCKHCNVYMFKRIRLSVKRSEYRKFFVYRKWYKCRKCGRTYLFKEDQMFKWQYDKFNENMEALSVIDNNY